MIFHDTGMLGGRMASAGTRSASRYDLSVRPIPSRPGGVISFALRESGRASLAVFDVRGRTVSTLLDGVLPRGEHRAVFDGARVPSGIYFAVLRSEGETRAKRIAVLK